MRKLIFITIFTALLIGLSTNDNLLWAKRMLLGDHTVHVVKKGESLSKISLQYYGTTKYWKALAIANRAPDADLIFPDEQIVIPDQESVSNVQRARSITAVNRIMGNVVEFLAINKVEPSPKLAQTGSVSSVQSKGTSFSDNEPMVSNRRAEQSSMSTAAQKPTEAATASVFPELGQQESASFNSTWLIIPVLVIGGLLALFIWRKKRRQREGELQTDDNDANTSEDGGSVLTGFEASDYAQDEPDYSKTRPRRKKAEELVTVS